MPLFRALTSILGCPASGTTKVRVCLMPMSGELGGRSAVRWKRTASVRVFTAEGVWKRYALPTKAPRDQQRIQQHTAQEALADVGIDVDAATIAKASRDLDRDGSGLTFKAFQKLVDRTQNKHGHLSAEELRRLMGTFDTEGKGYITAEEFRKIWEDRLTPSEVEELMVAADRNLDGQIDFDEFCQLMCPDLYLHEMSPSPELRRAGSPELPVPLALQDSYEAAEKDTRESAQRREGAARDAARYAGDAEAATKLLQRHQETLEGDWIDAAAVQRAARAHAEERQRLESALAGHSGVIADTLRQTAAGQTTPDPVVINAKTLPAHQELHRTYAFRRAVGNQNNVLPPGLASFKEGTNWSIDGKPSGSGDLRKKWGREEELRGGLRDAYAAGFMGKDDKAGSDAAAQLHALGLWRRMHGNALSLAGEINPRVASENTRRLSVAGGHVAAAPDVWVSSSPLVTAAQEPMLTNEFLDGKSVLEMLGIQQVPPAEYNANSAAYKVRWASCAGSVPAGNEAEWPGKVGNLEDAQRLTLISGNNCLSTGADGDGPFSLCGGGEEGAAIALRSAQSTRDGRLWVALLLRPEDAEVLDAFDGRGATTGSERVVAAAAAGESIRNSFKGSGKLGAQLPGDAKAGTQPYGHFIVGHLSEGKAQQAAQSYNALTTGQGGALHALLAAGGGEVLSAGFGDRSKVVQEEETARRGLVRESGEARGQAEVQAAERDAKAAAEAAAKAVAEKQDQVAKDRDLGGSGGGAAPKKDAPKKEVPPPAKKEKGGCC
eukprot:Hpha_TRINITY_DN13914_c0_g1::TRINITY_DN13914_c0_g1_i1::g.35465::m.35465